MALGTQQGFGEYGAIDAWNCWECGAGLPQRGSDCPGCREIVGGRPEWRRCIDAIEQIFTNCGPGGAREARKVLQDLTSRLDPADFDDGGRSREACFAKAEA